MIRNHPIAQSPKLDKEQRKLQSVEIKELSAKLISLKQFTDEWIECRNELVEVMSHTIWACVSKYFSTAPEVSQDDLYQEAVLRLCKNMHKWDPAKASISTYTWINSRGAIINLILAKKNLVKMNVHIVKNTKVYQQSLDAPIDGIDGGCSGLDILTDPTQLDALSLLSVKNDIEAKLKIIESLDLSGLMKDALHYYLQGYCYLDIAEKLGKNTKQIDNAIERVRNRIKRATATDQYDKHNREFDKIEHERRCWEMRQKGMTMAMIGKRVGRSACSILRATRIYQGRKNRGEVT